MTTTTVQPMSATDPKAGQVWVAVSHPHPENNGTRVSITDADRYRVRGIVLRTGSESPTEHYAGNTMYSCPNLADFLAAYAPEAGA